MRAATSCSSQRLARAARTTRAASCAPPSAIVAATQGTTARFAATAYGVSCKNVAAPRGQTPAWVAIERTSASRTRFGKVMRASIHRSSGRAQTKIALTHENESANEAVATLAGRANASASAASANAFQENVARPNARAASTAVAIVAARTAGSCPPLHATKPQIIAVAAMHAAQRGAVSIPSSANAIAATAPRWSPAVTKTWTVPVS